MYEWIKALHIIAVIAWMAGMLYLPRLFVYHCEVEAGSKQSETFKIMERRLLKMIINPAMIVTWLAGLEARCTTGSRRCILLRSSLQCSVYQETRRPRRRSHNIAKTGPQSLA